MDAQTLPVRFSIALRIYSGPIAPPEISAFLDLDATSAIALEALPEPIRTTKLTLGKANGWFLKSEDVIASRDPRVHLDWFIAKTLPIKNKLKQLVSWQRLQADVFLVLWSKDGGVDLALTKSDLAALASLELPVIFSFADYPDDAEFG